MKISGQVLGIGLIALGLVVLFLGDKIQNVGDEIDSLITNKWVGIIALGLGAFILVGPSIKLKTREI